MSLSGGGLGISPILWRNSYAGRAFRIVRRSGAESAPVDDSHVAVMTSLADDVVSISHGTAIVASDGRKVGDIEDIVIGPEGELHGVVGGYGPFHRHRIEIPGAWIAGISDERVRLSVPAFRVTES